MIEAQQQIIKAACFNDKLVGEHALYNGKDIVCTPEVGATLSRTDWNDAATSIENAVIGDLASFSVLAEDVPHPQEGDTITYNDETYKVASIALYDSVAGVYVLACMVNAKGIGR